MISNYPVADQPEWDALLNRPTIAIGFAARSTSLVVVSRPCILDGWALRETTGTGSALVEFFDGLDATGNIVGEQVVPAPSTIAAGNVDVDIDASSATPAAANNVTLAGVAGATTFITGFEISGNGATAAGPIAVTVTGVLGGTKQYALEIPTIAGALQVLLAVEFSRPIPASALNTAIVVNVPSFGAGNTAAAVTAHGFQRTAGAAGANAGQTASGPGGLGFVLCRNGVFMRVIAGSVAGSVWVKV